MFLPVCLSYNYHMEQHSTLRLSEATSNSFSEFNAVNDNSVDIRYIGTEDVGTPSLSFEIANLELHKLQSANRGKVLESLQDWIEKKQQAEEREICLQEICFERAREKESQEQHKKHNTIKLSTLLQSLQVLKCNYHFTQAQPDKVTNILDNLDEIYNQIQQFELELVRLFTKIKQDAHRHINEVKQSFWKDYYEEIKAKVTKKFDYSNVKYALAEIERFKSIKYPNLDYPNFKICGMKNRMGKSNADCKVECIESVNSWIEKIYAHEKLDSKVIFNRSIATFMRKSPCQKSIFSYYLKSGDYLVQGKGKVLKRIDNTNDNIPIAVVEKEMLPQAAIRFKIVNKGEGSIFIGVSPLRKAQQNKFQNCIKEKGSYYLTDRGDFLPLQSARKHPSNLRLNYKQNEQILIIRQQLNVITWRRRRPDKSEMEVRAVLALQDYNEHLYCCIYMQDKATVIQIVQ